MKRYIQHEFLKISHFATKEWLHPVHNHNHFEIIFIHSGKGTHCVSGMNRPYAGKCLFVLGPCDSHYFQIEEETEFTFLKFTNAYISVNEPHLIGSATSANAHWNQEIDHLLIHVRKQGLPVWGTDREVDKMDQLVRLIAQEWEETKNETSQTVFYLMRALLSMLLQNMTASLPAVKGKQGERRIDDSRITKIINYVHEHIYSPEHIQLDHLAKGFGYSKHYLGMFFKEQTGISLRDYLNQYRLHIIENRLRHSSFTLKEIGYELGFTDPSHLNKFFKAQKKMTPSAFRDQVTTKPLPIEASGH
jgi:AraC-like DNA-binding protein